MILCLDLDGVLGDIHPPLDEELRKDFSIGLPSEVGPDTWDDFLRDNGIHGDWAYKLFSNEWFWSRVVPKTENIKVVRRWKDAGHEIHVVTSRKQKALIPTKAWLKKHGVPYDVVALTRVMKKHEYLQEVGADIIVEDLFYEAYKCAAFGFRSYVIRTPYNAHHEQRIINPLCKYVNSLEEVEL